jgi:hypothetical protein
MIEKQLDGQVRRDWTDTGLVVTITVPNRRETADDIPSK